MCGLMETEYNTKEYKLITNLKRGQTMKKVILSMALLVMVGASFTACKNENKQKVHNEEIASATYQCPMKCEGDKTYADKDTKCPVCGMGLKEIKQENEHSDHDN